MHKLIQPVPLVFTMASGFRFCSLACLITGFTACGYDHDPHRNFVNNNQAMVGMNYKKFWKFVNEKRLSEVILPNGNALYRYRYVGSCIEVLEVDLKTDRIVRAEFEGAEKDCVLNP